MVNPAQLFKLKKAQSQIKKRLEQVFAAVEKGNMSAVVRGDKRIEKIVVDGVEQKDLKGLINDCMKEVEKKIEKQMRGQEEEILGLFK
ncbi:hypothetical protein HYW61_01170 [candidate division WWE3 bacterium]|nr:hypothetical protein [candidate division WWE3 bacterium]